MMKFYKTFFFTRNILFKLPALCFIISCSNSGNKPVLALYSKYVRDSFQIYLDFPTNYSRDSSNSIVFYMDANLKIGNEIRKQIKLDENKEKLKNILFVGVGHIGNYRKLRRRDFIPPKVVKGSVVPEDDPDFGHADDFYKFLTTELIPYINHNYRNDGYYSFIGHSFSGLFSFYCLMQPENAFRNYIALSPSLWVNYYNFFELEPEFNKNGRRPFDVTLYHACGTGEWTNKVLATSRRMHEILIHRDYPGLNYIYQEHKGKTHNDVVPVSLQYVLKEINLGGNRNYR